MLETMWNNPEIWVMTTEPNDKTYFINPNSKVELTDHYLIIKNGFIREVIHLDEETPYKCEVARLVSNMLKKDIIL